MATAEKKKELPHVRAICPITEMMFGTLVIEKHYCKATLCKNNTIHIYCLLHMFRGFIKHPAILAKLLEAPHGEQGKAAPQRPFGL